MKTWKMMIGKDSVYSVVAETEHIVKKYGMGCGAKATPERLADFARYDAARRANNRTAEREERRYRLRRKALAEQDKRHGEKEAA